MRVDQERADALTGGASGMRSHAKLLVLTLTLSHAVCFGADAAEKKKPAGKSVKPDAAAPAKAAPQPAQAPAQTPPAAAPLQPVAAPSVSSIGQAVAQAGVKQCVQRVDQVTGFLAGDGTQGAMIFADPAIPDRNLVAVSQEIQGVQGTMYAATTYSPGPEGCAAVYDVVTYWPNMSCSEVARTTFASFARGKPLRQNIEVLDGGPSAKLFLLTAGVNCIAIKKEVLFR